MASVAGVDFRAIDKANFSITASQAGQVDRCGDGLRSTAPGAGRKSPHAYKSGTIPGLIGSVNQDAEAARRARSERGNHHHFLRKIDLRQLGSGATTLEDFRPDGAPRLHITDHDALGREHAAVAGERVGLAAKRVTGIRLPSVISGKVEHPVPATRTKATAAPTDLIMRLLLQCRSSVGDTSGVTRSMYSLISCIGRVEINGPDPDATTPEPG